MYIHVSTILLSLQSSSLCGKKDTQPPIQIRMSIGFFENVHDILFMYSCILFLTFQNAKILITISVILF